MEEMRSGMTTVQRGGKNVFFKKKVDEKKACGWLFKGRREEISLKRDYLSLSFSLVSYMQNHLHTCVCVCACVDIC